MTVKELKEEAKKLGYIIAKKREYIKLVPCSECGSTRIIRWTELNHTQFYRCRVCGKSSTPRKYKYEAQEQWNLENKQEKSMLKRALILKGTFVEVIKTLEKLCDNYKNCTVERCIIIESSKERMKRRLREQNER